MSGLRAEELGDLIFSDHGSAKIGDKTFGFLIILDGAASHLKAHPCKSTSTSEVSAEINEWMDTFQMNPKAWKSSMSRRIAQRGRSRKCRSSNNLSRKAMKGQDDLAEDGATLDG